MPERSDIHLLCADISGAVERILLYISEMTYREFILTFAIAPQYAE